MQLQSLTLLIQNQRINVDTRLIHISGYLKTLQALTQESDLVVSNISKQTLNSIIRFAEINNYKEFNVSHVQSNNLQQSIGEVNAKFFQQFSNRQSIQLLMKAALILEIKCLIQCCASYFATLIYFKKHDLQQYKQVKKRLGIQKQFTHQVSMQLKAKYPLLLNE